MSQVHDGQIGNAASSELENPQTRNVSRKSTEPGGAGGPSFVVPNRGAGAG
jgi:hypothetical protein